MAGHQKDFLADSRASPGQNKSNTRTFEGQNRLTRTIEDKPKTDLGQAEDKKDLRRAATEGKCNFTDLLL